MEFTKDDVINSIKLYKNLNKQEIDHLIKNIEVINIENNLKDTIKKFINIDYYKIIKKFNYKYENLKKNDDITDSKPTKSDIKNIIKLFNDNENVESLNKLIDNPFNIKDSNLRDTLFKLRLNKNPEKFLNKIFQIAIKMKGGNQFSEQNFNSPNQDIMKKEMQENMEYEKQQQMHKIQQQMTNPQIVNPQMMNPQMMNPQMVNPLMMQHQQVLNQQPYHQQPIFNQMQMNSQPSLIQMQQQMLEQQQQINQIQHQIQQLNQM